MANLTIRNLDESLKLRLRVRAASRGRSMEEEVRHILRAALSDTTATVPHLAQRIRQRFGALGDVQLPVAVREPVREPPAVDAGPAPGRREAAGAPRSGRARRRP